MRSYHDATGNAYKILLESIPLFKEPFKERSKMV